MNDQGIGASSHRLRADERPDAQTPESLAEARLGAFLEEQEAESPLTQYVQVLLRRRWLVLGLTIAGVLGALFITATTTRLYRATASLEIAREAAKVVNVAGVEPNAQIMNQEFYQTQYGLLKSRALAELVVRKLRLTENDAFLYGYTGDTAPANAPARGGANRANMERRAAGILMSHLAVQPVRSSSLVNVSFDSPDPQLSARVVNAIAENFIASNLARRFDASAYARKFLEDRLAQVRARLEESERALVSYASKERIINLDAPGGSGSDEASATPGQSLVASDLTALNAALTTAKTERAMTEARFNQARRGGGIGVAETLADPTIGQLRNSRAALSADYSRMLAQFKPDYPTMVALKRQIDEVDRQLARQTGSVVSSLKANYDAAVQREANLQAQVDGLKDSVLDLRSRSIQYNIYQRDADTNRTLYDGLLQRYKEIGIAGGVGTNNVSVVDAALPPSSPFTPRTSMNLLLGFMVGLLLGAAIAFLLEQLDESIIAPHDLEKKLGVPLLGSIPKVAMALSPLEALDDSKSPISEAYLSVQTGLRFATSHGAPRALLTTSARAAEGKSTTSIAIARNFANLGRSVVLIDGDMRNPSIHKLLGLPNAVGLSNALAGADDLDPLIQRGPRDGMSVISSGPIPPNPAELLAGPLLSRTVAKLLEKYDHVVIDGPPVMGLADAPLISSYVEATVFVIAAKETRTKAARVSLRRLADVHAHIIGAILTKFDTRQVGYDYGYTYEYGESDSGSSVGKGFRKAFRR